MAIEDAAVLGNLLSRISHRSQLRPLLEAYQDIRLNRTAMAQESSRLSRRNLHLPEGPEQKARDEIMRKAMALELSGNSTPSHREGANMFFDYDADVEVDKWWAAHGRTLDSDGVESKF
jgi:salicylate hydroxylase